FSRSLLHCYYITFSLLSTLFFFLVFIFFFHDTSPTEIYTLSLHDALPIYDPWLSGKDLSVTYSEEFGLFVASLAFRYLRFVWDKDRKSTRLNSSHVSISYAVFCLKKKKNIIYK